MAEKEKMTVYIISDSIGETAYNLATAATVQFPEVEFTYHRFPLSKTTSLLAGILEQAKRANAFVVHTLVGKGLAGYVNQFCKDNNLYVLDGMSKLINTISQKTGLTPLYQAGRNHKLNKTYFNRIEALEFAVTYDDGKDPKGFLQADIVLLGVSRTSKTPLSLYLANKNYKVANLPLVPQTNIPEELWQVDPQKIFGLTNDPQVLNNIRKERLVTYGLNPETNYSNLENIEAELKFAEKLYKKIGCLVINVSNKSIEETATLITESLPL
ncbi:pyruvate, water dikinase regulatory protein [Liquorilactobacillus oeni]|uniref:Putative pyruvate, phosphate dikinase regulatory protein n=1 Tax=Liquorilactobacillus oeni DSM 19972 TaxID=1423777 RepID=A0A0R1MIM9_9LACO|nr:pyruvate, water dikinase regulatory protein [Liquorilactobacillus oeni]KRL04307.1 PEP synthetase regulatory protein [Liquorilactobacillus oeni DSM 19972]